MFCRLFALAWFCCCLLLGLSLGFWFGLFVFFFFHSVVGDFFVVVVLFRLGFLLV